MRDTIQVCERITIHLSPGLESLMIQSAQLRNPTVLCRELDVLKLSGRKCRKVASASWSEAVIGHGVPVEASALSWIDARVWEIKTLLTQIHEISAPLTISEPDLITTKNPAKICHRKPGARFHTLLLGRPVPAIVHINIGSTLRGLYTLIMHENRM